VERLARYQQLLATEGVARGLIGPREVDRLWDRHLDNCLAVAQDEQCLPHGASVLDVGTGAGLPGLVWALTRPDLRITLLEPLERRVRFLEEAVADLGVSVEVVRGRVQDVAVHADRVTARAVAPTATLLVWCAPRVSPGGRMVLLKGQRAQAELAQAQGWLDRHGWTAQIRMVGDPPRTRVVVVERQEGR
jgi:16S rRNA (guanine527-N7)-methyltransferase